ncbi:integrator complex subunit 10-like [Daphnia pulicaria]|uniref:integrator complex subunit 10-like n=1 Tax=Daphnia pulicaria TaxID=35523 RepID=UPI001EEBFCC5|nr:integrator complex subunit 10-like [Daphnia pulicaria]
MQENQLSDEEYVIYRTKSSQKLDAATAKAWMITAKTLFPRNFAVQLEAYTTQKSANNPKEAARYFSSLFFDFPNEVELWEEVQEITSALQKVDANESSRFYRDLFSHMLTEVQHQLLLSMAERAEDTIEHCRLMLVLLARLPQFVDTHGKKLVDTLLTTEKHSHYQTPVNCFRKLLVVDLLPTLLGSRTIDVPQKQLYRLILKSIEFYVNWFASGSPLIQGVEGSELKTEEAWTNLFKIMFAMGRKLGWELSSMFSIENRELMCQNLWAFFRSTPLGDEDSPNFRQLLYCTTVLLVESLYEYMRKIDPACFQIPNQGNKMETTQLLLVRAFLPSVDSGLESALKRRKEENSASHSTLNVTVTKSCPTPTATTLLSSFLTAVSCWELLQQTEELRNEFSKICLHLRTESWLWLPNFIADVYLHQGLYAEALTKLQSVGSTVLNPQSFLLKSSGIFFGLGNHIAATEQILHAVANLPLEGGSDLPTSFTIPCFSSPIGKPPLHFMALNRTEIVQYSVSVLLACLQDRAFKNGNSDLAVGHLIVLLQYDWPNNSNLLEESLEKIRRQGQFTYQLFSSYVIQVDILEEIAYLVTDQGGAINVDIFPPSAAQLATQRRMTTRRGDLGAREDFRSAMKRQMGRSPENIQNLMIRFMIRERENILQAMKV